MTELFIDGLPVDLDAGCTVELSLSLKEITAPGEVTEKICPLTLPMSARNRAVLGFPEQALSSKRFNHEKHTGKITCRGAVLLTGPLELTGCNVNADGSGEYRLSLRVPPPAWIERAALKKLSETAVDYDKILNEQTIRESWTDNSPVKFLPVKRDSELAYGQSQGVLDSLWYENYHPFVQVKALLDAITGAAGYRIESQFLNDPFFQSLYMSGRYGGTPATENVSRMDFVARRNAADKSISADSQGRVYTSAGSAANSVGPAVDILQPATATDNPYYGKSLRTIDGRFAFVPETDVIAGFEWQMKVRFTPQLYSSTQLRGLFRIGWDDETIYEGSSLPNPLTDHKNSGGKPGQYRLVCFDNQTKARRITIHYTRGTTASNSTSQPASVISCAYDFSHAVCEESQNGIWMPVDNWAFYVNAEYQAFTSQTRVEELNLSLRSAPLLRSGNEPLFFDTLVFETAPGSTFTLCQGATVRPFFYAMPQAGKPAAFAALFAHEKKQQVLIEAVAHLFGLHFYTDESAKVIYIEPRFTFLDNTHPLDWTSKIDPEKPFVWEESGNELYETETIRYRPGDAVIERNDAGTGKIFGQWSAHSGHRFARKGERIDQNPLFTATRDERNSLRSAPDASMIVVGNRNGKNERLDFPEKIVRYLGMLPLPDGQRWGWPAAEQKYPAVMFPLDRRGPVYTLFR